MEGNNCLRKHGRKQLLFKETWKETPLFKETWNEIPLFKETWKETIVV